MLGARASLVTLGAAATAASLLASTVFACSSGSPFGESVVAVDAAGTDGDVDASSGADATGGGEIDAAHPMPDAAAVSDGSKPRLSIACGPTPCTTSGDVCCWDRAAMSPAGYSCAHQIEACPVAGAARYACDDTEDCNALGHAGTVCCGTLGTNGMSYFPSGATCVVAENCVGANEVQLCNRGLAGECPSGKPCVDLTSYRPSDAGGSQAVVPSVPACAP